MTYKEIFMAATFGRGAARPYGGRFYLFCRDTACRVPTVYHIGRKGDISLFANL